MHLPALRESRASKIDALRGIVTAAEKEKRDMTEAEQAAFDTGKTELEAIEKQVRNAEFLQEYERRASGEPITNGDAGFENQCREFSIRKAIASQIYGLQVDAGREREVSQELERRGGVKAEGILVPTAVFEKRVITSGLPSAGPGGVLITADWRPEQFIDRLREAMVIRRLGARVLDNLTGNVAIPALSASATLYWVAENSAITASDAQFGQVQMTPKHAGCLTEVSRNMILQSSPAIEELLRSDFAALLARGLDAVAIKGGGTNEPTGILSASGVAEVVGAGGNGLAPTWANVIALVNAVAANNVDNDGTFGFVTNTKVTGKLATVLKSTADTSSNYILATPGDTTLAGFPLGQTNLVPSNLVKGSSGAVASALIFGRFSDLLIGYWSAFDLLVNPFDSTAYPKGNVLVRGMMTVDVALRHTESFAKSADILTT
jgi:HK97 family phage major capsid protein